MPKSYSTNFHNSIRVSVPKPTNPSGTTYVAKPKVFNYAQQGYKNPSLVDSTPIGKLHEIPDSVINNPKNNAIRFYLEHTPVGHYKVEKN